MSNSIKHDELSAHVALCKLRNDTAFSIMSSSQIACYVPQLYPHSPRCVDSNTLRTFHVDTNFLIFLCKSIFACNTDQDEKQQQEMLDSCPILGAYYSVKYIAEHAQSIWVEAVHWAALKRRDLSEKLLRFCLNAWLPSKAWALMNTRLNVD